MTRTHNVVFVVGAPGAGKTTALRTLATPADVRINDNDVRWTLKAPYAFIGVYRGEGLEDSSNMGGDSVARHANRLSLEYWKRNILPNPRYTTTFLEGEMFLWDSHLAALRGDLNFIPEEQKKHYLPGGLYSRTFAAIENDDVSRFPVYSSNRDKLPEVRVSCLYLNVSPEFSLERRRAREGKAEADATKNSDRHMQTAASKQRNFAQKFKDASSSVSFMLVVDETPKSKFLEVNVEGVNPDEVVEVIRKFTEGLK